MSMMVRYQQTIFPDALLDLYDKTFPDYSGNVGRAILHFIFGRLVSHIGIIDLMGETIVDTRIHIILHTEPGSGMDRIGPFVEKLAEKTNLRVVFKDAPFPQGCL
jgi:hypothetical protein